MLRITVPLPPSTNTAYATYNGRRLLSVKGRAYKHETGWRVRQSARNARKAIETQDVLQPSLLAA